MFIDRWIKTRPIFHPKLMTTQHSKQLNAGYCCESLSVRRWIDHLHIFASWNHHQSGCELVIVLIPFALPHYSRQCLRVHYFDISKIGYLCVFYSVFKQSARCQHVYIYSKLNQFWALKTTNAIPKTMSKSNQIFFVITVDISMNSGFLNQSTNIA